MQEDDAAKYEKPFEYVKKHVKPDRERNNRLAYAERWWIHTEARPTMRSALTGLKRYIGTPNLTKYRLFVWLPPKVLPDHQLIVFARDDDYFFGVLHSRAHEVWALQQGTQLESRRATRRQAASRRFRSLSQMRSKRRPSPWRRRS